MEAVPTLMNFLETARSRIERRGLRGSSPSYALLTGPVGAELAVVSLAALVRMGETNAG